MAACCGLQAALSPASVPLGLYEYGRHALLHERRKVHTCKQVTVSPLVSSFLGRKYAPSNLRPNWQLGKTKSRTRRQRRCKEGNKALSSSTVASIVEFSSEDFAVERLVGTFGFMNMSSITPASPAQGLESMLGENTAAGYDLQEVNRMAGQDMRPGSVEIKLYKGKIIEPGPRKNTRVLLKAYPGRRAAGGADADTMAANELATHAILQDAAYEGNEISENVAVLLGGFQTRTGEQWLVLRDDGAATAADYARLAAAATSAGGAVGEGELWDRWDRSRPITRRQRYILAVLRGVMRGLAFLHSRGRLHQSLGPASVGLNLVDERDAKFVVPRLRDFAFSVDVSSEQESLRGPLIGDLWDMATSGAGSGADGGVGRASNAPQGPPQEQAELLWRRAAAAGAKMMMDRRAFGISDDIYAAGLLLAYMAFVPLCQAGSIDGPSLQKLLENTFRLDIPAVRDYCAADERWVEAVRFLDLGGGAGWNLLQAMLDPDFRKRPTADAVLNHPFLAAVS
eukprot:jgi/Mesen1/1174/ME000124S00211